MEPIVRAQLEDLQRRAHRSTLNGNATVELCRVVADLIGLIGDQQERIEHLMNTPAPFTSLTREQVRAHDTHDHAAYASDAPKLGYANTDE